MKNKAKLTSENKIEYYIATILKEHVGTVRRFGWANGDSTQILLTKAMCTDEPIMFIKHPTETTGCVYVAINGPTRGEEYHVDWLRLHPDSTKIQNKGEKHPIDWLTSPQNFTEKDNTLAEPPAAEEKDSKSLYIRIHTDVIMNSFLHLPDMTLERLRTISEKTLQVRHKYGSTYIGVSPEIAGLTILRQQFDFAKALTTAKQSTENKPRIYTIKIHPIVGVADSWITTPHDMLNRILESRKKPQKVRQVSEDLFIGLSPDIEGIMLHPSEFDFVEDNPAENPDNDTPIQDYIRITIEGPNTRGRDAIQLILSDILGEYFPKLREGPNTPEMTGMQLLRSVRSINNTDTSVELQVQDIIKNNC